MDRHKVGTDIAKKAVQIIARDGHASAQSLSLDIPCKPRTADRIVAFLKDTGRYVKQGYGIAPKDSATKIPPHSATSRHHKDSATPKESTTYDTKIPPHRATFGHKHPATTKIPPQPDQHSATSKDPATTKDSATSCFQQDSQTLQNIAPSQTLNEVEAVQTEAANPAGFGLGSQEVIETEASVPIGGPSGEQKDVDAIAPLSLALRGAGDTEEQPEPGENEQALLEYREWLVLKHKTKEITGVGEAAKRRSSDGVIVKDRDMAAYHEDLDKLIGVLSAERDAWKLNNRQLGKARGQCKITRSELCSGKKNHSELLRVIVDLTEDRESGELRYSNLQAAGETLDIAWNGWRQKMAMDPDLIQHYRDMAAQQLREARKEAWEAKRDAAQDLKDEIEATKSAAVQEPAPVMATESGFDPEWDAVMKEHREQQAAALARTSVYLVQEPTPPAPAVKAAPESADIFDDRFGPATQVPAAEPATEPAAIPESKEVVEEDGMETKTNTSKPVLFKNSKTGKIWVIGEELDCLSYELTITKGEAEALLADGNGKDVPSILALFRVKGIWKKITGAHDRIADMRSIVKNQSVGSKPTPLSAEPPPIASTPVNGPAAAQEPATPLEAPVAPAPAPEEATEPFSNPYSGPEWDAELKEAQELAPTMDPAFYEAYAAARRAHKKRGNEPVIFIQSKTKSDDEPIEDFLGENPFPWLPDDIDIFDFIGLKGPPDLRTEEQRRQGNFMCDEVA